MEQRASPVLTVSSNASTEMTTISAQKDSETDVSTSERIKSPEVLMTSTSSSSSTLDHTPKSHANSVSFSMLYGVSIVSLYIDGKERLCLAQISNTLLKRYSYNEIHNRRVALGITCVQCTPVQLEILRRAGAMPISSRRCGMITKREAERLVKSFLEDNSPPKLPDNFAFDVKHSCGWGCRGSFIPSRYNSSRAKCIKCYYCNMYFSPNKFIFHYHRTHDSKYSHPDAANFNSWRRHMFLSDANAPDDLVHAWEDVKAMFNGGSRKRILNNAISSPGSTSRSSNAPPESKRSRLSSESSTPASSLPVQSAPFPCPIYPVVPGKMMPPGLKPIPQHPAMFGFPYSLQKPSIISHPPVKTQEPNLHSFGSVHDTLYPPYEMIWAKHLGLASPESSLVNEPGRGLSGKRTPPSIEQSHRINLSPAKLDHVTDFSAETLLNCPENSKIKDSSAKKSPECQSNYYTSAFKPVLGGAMPHPAFSNSMLMSPPNDGTDRRCETFGPDSENGSSARCESGSEESECEESVDVDTVDDIQEPNNNLDEQKSDHNTPADNPDDSISLAEPEVHNNGSFDTFSEQEGSPVEDGHRAPTSPQPSSPSDVAAQDTTDSVLASSTTKACGQWFQEPDREEDCNRARDLAPVSRDGVYRDFSSFTKERLQEELLIEIEARKKIELDCCSIKETFREQIDREKQYRDDMSRQLQLVKETLRQELDQERNTRLILQQKLKEAHEALQSFSCKMMTSRSSSMALIPR